MTCRLALGVMGFYWIRAEMTSPKRGYVFSCENLL